MKKFLFAVCLSLVSMALLGSCSSPTKPYPAFGWAVSGSDGAAVTISYRRNGQHIDISGNGSQLNQGILPISLSNQYLAPGDIVSLTISYMSGVNAFTTVRIDFSEDDNSSLASESGKGTVTCTATIK